MKNLLIECLLATVLNTIFILATTEAAAQKKTLYLDTLGNTCTPAIDVAMRTKSFSHIIGMQGTIAWDTSVLKYNSLIYGTSAISFNASNTNLTQTDNGYLTFLWFDNTLAGQSVADTTKIFTIRFNVNKRDTGKTSVRFLSTPSSLEIDTVDAVTGIPALASDTAFTHGYVDFIRQPRINVNGNVLTCVANGIPVKYQWNAGFTPIAGAESSTFTLPPEGNANSYTVTVTYANGCSSTSVYALPLKLTHFTAWHNTDSTYLTWTTASEENTAFYNIQRSSNGTGFTNIGAVSALNGKNGATYNYTDRLGNPQVDKLYYRLMIEDKDGKRNYSNVIIVKSDGKPGISIYPNPAKDHLFVQLNKTKVEKVIIQITDIQGRVLKEQHVSLNGGNISITMNVSGLARGSYLLIVNGGESWVKRFVRE